jgi:Xaa-Pro aminopeptidase
MFTNIAKKSCNGMRLRRLSAILQKNRLQGILISHQPNIAYLTGFLSSDSYLLVTPRRNFFITDSRYEQQARFFLKRELEIKLSGRSVFKTIANLASDSGIKRLGFESRNLDYAQFNTIKRLIPQIRFIATTGLIEELRQIKGQDELIKIKKAVSIAVEALRYARSIVRAGIVEIEIAAELERFIKYKGGRTTSFETIVASGENSAFPHHLTSRRRVKSQESLVIDIGVDYQGYKSDLTRTLFLGRIPFKLHQIYGIVKEAQSCAINRIKPGIKICEIDKVARQYITKQGYGGFFAHNLGHGIGLEIHEQPYISTINKAILKQGMVFTVEPAIYLSGKFGVRVEDDVVVTRKGCEVLSDNLHK